MDLLDRVNEAAKQRVERRRRRSRRHVIETNRGFCSGRAGDDATGLSLASLGGPLFVSSVGLGEIVASAVNEREAALQRFGDGPRHRHLA